MSIYSYMKSFAVVAVTSAAGFIGTGSATFAATCSLDAVTLNSIDGTAVPTINATACDGVFSGNLNPTEVVQSLENGTVFAGEGLDLLDWTYLDKSDSGSSLVTADNGQVTGNWAADFSPDYVEMFIVNIKSGLGYSMFLFDGITPAASAFGGTFDTELAGLVNKKGDGQELSHLDVAGVYITMVPMPLPASGLLLIGGLGGLAAMRRRRKAKE